MFSNLFFSTAIVDSFVALLFFALLLWGRKNQFCEKGAFNDDFTNIEVMKSLRGFAALGIVIGHAYEIFLGYGGFNFYPLGAVVDHSALEPAFQYKGFFSLFPITATYCVSIFMFCSGFGLVKSLNTKKDYFKGFVKNRIGRALVIPFYVDALIYGLYMLLTNMPLKNEQWVCNLLGITLMDQYAWFPIVLTILYFLFYLCFRYIKKRSTCYAIILVVMITLGVGFCFNGHYVWWVGPENWWVEKETAMAAKWWQWDAVRWFCGEWWVNTMPAFFTGIIFSTYEEKIVAFFKKSYAKRFCALLVITAALFTLSEFTFEKFGYWSEFQMNGPEIMDKLITYFTQIPVMALFPITVFIFMMKFRTINPVTRFYGKYAFYTYLMNLMAIELFRFMEYREYCPVNFGIFAPLVYLICVVAASSILAVGEQKIVSVFQNLIFKKKEVRTPV